MPPATPPVFRFAPSPTGLLHLGHARSALLNQRMAQEAGGRLLLRIEDIDATRCRPEYERAILRDLEWLGVEWHGPVRRQSEHFDAYRDALEQLKRQGLIYPSFMTRSEIRDAVAARPDWPKDPDGAPHYPGDERTWSARRREAALETNPTPNLRLDMAAAMAACPEPLNWLEKGQPVAANPAAWADVALARLGTPASYHLCVVVDDAVQSITDVVRGDDLYHATSIHRLLQTLLGLPAPRYHHHELLLDADGRKLSKRDGDTAISALRERGLSQQDVAERAFA